MRKLFLKRSVAWLLCLVLTCAMLPVSVFAVEGENLYGIDGENITVEAIDADDDCLSAIQAEAAKRVLGFELDETTWAVTYGVLLQTFQIESNENIVSFKMNKPELGALKGQYDVAGERFKILIQNAEDQSAPVYVFSTELSEDKTSLSVTIPTLGGKINCAIAPYNTTGYYHGYTADGTYFRQNSVTPSVKMADSGSAMLHYEWIFQGTSIGDEFAPFRYSSMDATIQLNVGKLVLDPSSIAVETPAFDVEEITGDNSGNWTIKLGKSSTASSDNLTTTNGITEEIKVSFDAALPSGMTQGSEVYVIAELLFIGPGDSGSTQCTTETAPLVPQRVIGINYVIENTSTVVGTGTILAGMDDTMISVDDLTAPEGYELAVEGNTVAIEDNNVATVPVKMKVFTIKTVVGPNGSIYPQGPVKVKAGEDQTFTFKPNSGYQVNTVMVDGDPVTITGNTYTFTNVTADHEIVVTFEKKSSSPVIIVPPDDDDDDQPEDPDDTGVSDLLNTKDHDQYLFGYPDGTFGPGLNMTRAEAAQMFYNLLVDQDVTAKPVFDDVPEGAWYAEPVNVMAKLDIVEGVGDNKFEPNREITRAEFTAMAMRFAEGETGGKNIFSDVDEDDWFYEVVVDSIKYGWIEGYPDGTFRPANLITREEVTTIVNRMLGRLPDEKFIDAHEDDLDLFPDVTKNWAYYDVVEATNDHQYKKTSSGEDWTKLG